MFCPNCRDEFRPGFNRCEACDVSLVESLDEASQTRAAERPPAPPVPLVEFCGFVSLDEARRARDQLRQAGIRWEIMIREASPDLHSVDQEEYWLRVEAPRMREVVTILGYDAADSGEGDLTCDSCGHTVSESEPSCPSCGARFDD
jgi:hypothetical protein